MTEQRAVRRHEQRVSGSGITGDEFQYIETVPASNYDALSTQLAEAKAEIERMRERESKLSELILWALGERDEFPMRPENWNELKYKPWYWWRTELRKRYAALIPAKGKGE